MNAMLISLISLISVFSTCMTDSSLRQNNDAGIDMKLKDVSGTCGAGACCTGSDLNIATANGVTTCCSKSASVFSNINGLCTCSAGVPSSCGGTTYVTGYSSNSQYSTTYATPPSCGGSPARYIDGSYFGTCYISGSKSFKLLLDLATCNYQSSFYSDTNCQTPDGSTPTITTDPKVCSSGSQRGCGTSIQSVDGPSCTLKRFADSSCSLTPATTNILGSSYQSVAANTCIQITTAASIKCTTSSSNSGVWTLYNGVTDCSAVTDTRSQSFTNSNCVSISSLQSAGSTPLYGQFTTATSVAPTMNPTTIIPSIATTVIPTSTTAPLSSTVSTPPVAAPVTSRAPVAAPVSSTVSTPPVAAPVTSPVVVGSPPGNSGSSSSTCFAGSNLITMENGLSKRISEISVGDRVLSYSTKTNSIRFSYIVAVPHGTNNKLADFLMISTVAGKEIKLTAEHLIEGGNCGQTCLVSAKSVKEGQCVLTVDGEEKVVSNVVTKEEGLYTIVTEEELVVVGGIVASPFAMNHFIPNMFYNVHRFFYAVMPKMLSTQIMDSVSIVADEIAQYYTVTAVSL